MTIKKIPIADIGLDPRLQHRVSLNNETIEAVQAMFDHDGELFWPESLPQLAVVQDGNLIYLWDGHARHAAALRAGMDEAACDVTQGDFALAFRLSLGANAAHGTRRNNDDIRKVLADAFADEKIAALGDSEIGKICGCSHTTVGKFRASCNWLQDAPSPVRTVTRKGKTFAQNTAKIGRTPRPKPAPAQPSQESNERTAGRDRFAKRGMIVTPSVPQTSSMHVKAQLIVDALASIREVLQEACAGSDSVLRAALVKQQSKLGLVIADIDLILNPAATPEQKLPVSLDSDAFRAAWAEWVTHRKQKKQALTPLSVKKQISQLEAMGEVMAIASINASITNGWTGLFTPKKGGTNGRVSRVEAPAGKYDGIGTTVGKAGPR